jgi:hypothetical protein
MMRFKPIMQGRKWKITLLLMIKIQNSSLLMPQQGEPHF